MITAASEREKYTRMWARPEYGQHPAVLLRTPHALAWAREHGCRTLYDYGCGPGWALDYFTEHGLSCHGYDIAPPVDRPDITEACLWGLPAAPSVDFAFCSDVLEHIPEDRLDDVLAGIRVRTDRAGFLRVFLGPDRRGHLIGETLHLTVRPVAWWLDTVARFFGVARHEADGPALNMWVTP